MSEYQNIDLTQDGKYDVPKIINLKNENTQETLESQCEAANNAQLQCYSLLTEIKIMSKQVCKMTRQVSNCLKAVRKSKGTSINKVAPSPSIINPTSNVELQSNSVDIKQIPVIDPNSWKYICPYVIDYNLLNYREKPTTYYTQKNNNQLKLEDELHEFKVIRDNESRPQYINEDVDQGSIPQDNLLQSLRTCDKVVWADEMPAYPSDSNPLDSGGELESFIQDSEDSNDYDGL